MFHRLQSHRENNYLTIFVHSLSTFVFVGASLETCYELVGLHCKIFSSQLSTFLFSLTSGCLCQEVFFFNLCYSHWWFLLLSLIKFNHITLNRNIVIKAQIKNDIKYCTTNSTMMIITIQYFPLVLCYDLDVF